MYWTFRHYPRTRSITTCRRVTATLSVPHRAAWFEVVTRMSRHRTHSRRSPVPRIALRDQDVSPISAFAEHDSDT